MSKELRVSPQFYTSYMALQGNLWENNGSKSYVNVGSSKFSKGLSSFLERERPMKRGRVTNPIAMYF